jgi:hypothetical protein
MQYKTIILELIRQNEPLHDRLQRERDLLVTVERMALELKASHQEHLRNLTVTKPHIPPTHASSQAFETALREMEERLLTATRADGDEPLSLDGAMAILARSPKK